MFSKKTALVGGLRIGGDAPVAVQTMYDSQIATCDTDAVLHRISVLKAMGCDLIRFSYERNDPEGSAAMTAVEAWVRNEARVRGLPLLGPVQSPIAFISNRMRYQCLFKTAEWSGVRTLYADLIRQPEAEKLRISLNLDPYSML